MADDDRFGIEMRLQLEERIAAARDIARRREMEHQTLAATGDDSVERPLQFGAIADPPLRREDERRAGARQDRSEPAEARLERSAADRRVEHHVADIAPLAVARHVAANDRRERVEAAATEPQLAVERQRRHRGEERRRRRDAAAAAMTQHRAVPERANAVVLLADEAERRVDLASVDARELRRERAPGGRGRAR